MNLWDRAGAVLPHGLDDSLSFKPAMQADRKTTAGAHAEILAAQHTFTAYELC